MKENTKGTLILCLGALVWGAAFVAQSAASDNVGTFTFNASRNILAVLFLLCLIAGRHVLESNGKIPAPDRNAATGVRFNKKVVVCSMLTGCALFCAEYFQQGGIGAYPPEAASAGRAGFLTATYVVFVSLVSWIIGRKRHILILAAAALCLAGMYLLCLSGGFGQIYRGDIMVLICALCFTVQILLIDRFSWIDGLIFSCIEFATSGTLAFLCAMLFEHPAFNQLAAAAPSILYAGIMSSGVGYTLQVIGQHKADPTSASIAMSLESVFSAMWGWILLGEMLSGRELLGCALVFAAVITAQLPDILQK